MKPLFTYPGGKAREIKYFEQYFPNDIDTYIEPFIGGGSVYFYLEPKKAVINDINEEIITFYREIKKCKGKYIYSFFKRNRFNKRTYFFIRDKMICKNDLQVAQRFFYLRRVCFRGMVRYNKRGRFNVGPEKDKRKIPKDDNVKQPEYHKQLQGTKIYCKDYSVIMRNYNSSNNFAFIDPPYDCSFNNYYTPFGEKEHKKLAKLFKKTKIRCLMTISKTPLTEQLYRNYIVGSYTKRYPPKIGTEANIQETLIIKNF